MATIHNSAGADYAFLEGGRAFSSGVVALPGFEIVRVRFARPLPIAEGFDAIAAHLRERHRPLTALCAAELRSPEPVGLAGFGDFNAGWVEVLESWGLFRNGRNPVARSNVCPVHDAPAQPVFHAFSYTVPVGAAQTGLLTTSDHAADAPGPRSFVIAGYAEWEQAAAFPEGIVAYRDTSRAGLARKAAFVLDGLQRNTAALGGDWSMVTAVQVYTAHEIGALVAGQFVPRDLARLGIDWHVCRPPIEGLEFEIDVRCVRRELVID
ncbi:MAG: hypothetical protein DWB43_10290 [Lautropia sp.]|nr:MAG: hypothetical protein EDM78_11950 [Pseudomonadota bacterium]MBC6959904.1 hypothetical protein [Lautropia sp.]MCL4702075.1 hypothetical protein [Burkholderiaceae bacterium]MCZ2415337.1 hypothetical protein [Burkholderiales bacterium]MDL1908447.1 hypothetical protein [Betaproteobacteria bacterium PRO1]